MMRRAKTFLLNLWYKLHFHLNPCHPANRGCAKTHLEDEQ